VTRSFFKNLKEKKTYVKENIQNERMNFAIFSYKIAMQKLYFKSPIAPNMLLSLSP